MFLAGLSGALSKLLGRLLICFRAAVSGSKSINQRDTGLSCELVALQLVALSYLKVSFKRSFYWPNAYIPAYNINLLLIRCLDERTACISLRHLHLQTLRMFSFKADWLTCAGVDHRDDCWTSSQVLRCYLRRVQLRLHSSTSMYICCNPCVS